MPLAVMNVPPLEQTARGRLVAKVENLLHFAHSNRGAGGGVVTQLGGELYECVCADFLITRNAIQHGDEFGRWDGLYATGGQQSLYPVINREKDFLFRAGNRLARDFLDEAKSYTGGLGPYIKDCAQMCLFDLQGQLGGFVMITPGDGYLLFLNTIFNVYQFVLEDGQAALRYAAQKKFLNETYPNLATHNYLQKFQDRAEVEANIPVRPRTETRTFGEIQREVQLPYGLKENQTRVARFLNQELTDQFGIAIECLRVSAKPRNALKDIWTRSTAVAAGVARLTALQVDEYIDDVAFGPA